MAIEEHDREDLLRDGKTMRLRGETTVEGQTIVVGFRSDGQLSLYCDADPVFQFNARQQLRRVFFGGQRYAAEKGQLVWLVRESKGGQVSFDRRAVSDECISDIQNSLEVWIERIRQATDSPSTSWRTTGDQWTDETEALFISTLRSWLRTIRCPALVASTPNA